MQVTSFTLDGLVRLVGLTVELRRQGSRWVGRCPFHGEDRNPSFHVNEARNGRALWGCWSCGLSGDAIDWIKRTQNVGYREAVHILGEEPKPDPAIKARRQAEKLRDAALSDYRDRNPDCVLPDWAIRV